MQVPAPGRSAIRWVSLSRTPVWPDRKATISPTEGSAGPALWASSIIPTQQIIATVAVSTNTPH